MFRSLFAVALMTGLASPAFAIYVPCPRDTFKAVAKIVREQRCDTNLAVYYANMENGGNIFDMDYSSARCLTGNSLGVVGQAKLGTRYEACIKEYQEKLRGVPHAAIEWLGQDLSNGFVLE